MQLNPYNNNSNEGSKNDNIWAWEKWQEAGEAALVLSPIIKGRSKKQRHLTYTTLAICQTAPQGHQVYTGY
jgi:hypothetical protein